MDTLTLAPDGPTYKDVVRHIPAPVELLEGPKTIGQEASDQSASLRRIAHTAEAMAEWRLHMDHKHYAVMEEMVVQLAELNMMVKVLAIFQGVIALGVALMLWVK